MPLDNCDRATPAVIQVATEISGGQFRWRMRAAPGLNRRIRVSPNGDLDFSRQRGPVLVTMRLSNPGWVWRAQNTVEFNDEPVRIVRNFVRPGNHQVQVRSLDGPTLTFCYSNHRWGGARTGGTRHDRSYYGLWVQNADQNHYIDPIISNGGRPGEEDPS